MRAWTCARLTVAGIASQPTFFLVFRVFRGPSRCCCCCWWTYVIAVAHFTYQGDRMLHRFAIQNFQSFRERTMVDLTLDGKAGQDDWKGACAAGARVSTILAVMGHNASGKTALLKPLAFLAWFIRSSVAAGQDAPIPVDGHFS